MCIGRFLLVLIKSFGPCVCASLARGDDVAESRTPVPVLPVTSSALLTSRRWWRITHQLLREVEPSHPYASRLNPLWLSARPRSGPPDWVFVPVPCRSFGRGGLRLITGYLNAASGGWLPSVCRSSPSVSLWRSVERCLADESRPRSSLRLPVVFHRSASNLTSAVDRSGEWCATSLSGMHSRVSLSLC